MRNHVVASRGFLDARDVTPIGLQTPPPQSLLREGSPAACRDPIPCGLGPRLGQTVGLGGAPCGCLPGGAIESPPCPAPLYIRGPRRSEACSHGNQKGIEPLFGNRQVIFLQHRNVETNRVPHLANGFFASLPLAHASGQAQALGHPIAVFALENHCLSHLLPSYPKVLDGSRSQGSRRPPAIRKQPDSYETRDVSSSAGWFGRDGHHPILRRLPGSHIPRSAHRKYPLIAAGQ